MQTMTTAEDPTSDPITDLTVTSLLSAFDQLSKAFEEILVHPNTILMNRVMFRHLRKVHPDSFPKPRSPRRSYRDQSRYRFRKSSQ